MKESQIKSRLTIFILTIVGIIALFYFLTSCASPEALTEPHSRDYRIVDCTPKKVWVTDCKEDSTNWCCCDTFSIRNRYRETMLVGGYLIEREECRKTYKR